MPELHNYLTAFGLTDGTVIAGYRLHLHDAYEETVVRYREYRYHGVLDFYPGTDANIQSLYDYFTHLINLTIQIYGKRDPYDCTLSINTITIDPHTAVVRMILLGAAHK